MKQHSKKLEYKVLTERDHIRARPGMWVGSVSESTQQEWIYDPENKKMTRQELTYIPALVKCFSEILDNAIDEARRHTDTDSIRVSFNDGSISVQDNGHGIPVEIHEQTGTYVPETVFTNLRAGSNFNDEEDQQLIGTNGVGSSCVVVLSSSFKIETCDGKQNYSQLIEDGMLTINDPKIKPGNKPGTKITFTPDYAFFGQAGLTEGNKLRMMKKVVDAAACNLNIKFYINSDRVAIKDFDDYVALYAEEYVSDSTPDWKVAISASDGFEQVSFVNSVETFQGGSHVDYVINQIADALRAHIKKKHKIDMKPADIRNHMRVYISANINRPKFSSQTKENMISPIRDYKTSWEVPDKMIKKIIQSTIIQSILDWAEAKAHQEQMRELRKLNRDTDKADPRRVEKFSDALEKKDRHKAILLLSEGDCLDAKEQVLTYINGDAFMTSMSAVKVGDLVLTHKNRLRKVLSTTKKVSEGIKITFNGKTMIVSPDHRLIAYHVPTEKFGEVAAKDLTVDHKLVKNQLIDVEFLSPVISVIPFEHETYDFEITFGYEVDEPTYASASHTFLVMDAEDSTFKMERADKLVPGRHLMVMKEA